MTGLLPAVTVFLQGGIGMGVELGRERRIVIGGDQRGRSRTGQRRKGAGLTPSLKVARDGVGADGKAIGHVLMGQAGIDGVNDLLAEVTGIRFHPVVNDTPLLMCNRL